MNKNSPRQFKKSANNGQVPSCARCGFNSPPQAKFCAECGTPLLVPLKEIPQWRPLTVLFCDLVGSTLLAERIDPEEWRALLLDYQGCCHRVVTQWGGTVAQFLGDGVLAYFGYPRAYEHDAQRAVEAALCLIEEVCRLASPGGALQIRMGLHTGPVIIGAEQSAGYLTAQAMGDTLHLAARLQAAAEPNTVLLSPTTARQVREFFALEKLTTRRLKGFSRETPVYRVREPQSGCSGGITSLVDLTLTPFIGRRQELGRGRQQWRRARAGHRQGLQIVGEPGIGKSCLIRALTKEASQEGGGILECRCSPYYQHSALHPFIDLLQREFGLTRTDSREAHYQKLKQGIESFGLPASKTLPLLGRLLNVADRESFPTLTPHRARERTLELLSALLTARAEHEPIIIVLEDLQWADPSTLELTEKLVTIQDHSPLLWVLSHRSDFALPWSLPAGTVRLELGRLTQAQSTALITRIAGKPLPHDVIQHLLAHTDGVPLFLEELTKAVLESDVLQEKDDRYERQGPLPTALLPDTILDSLMPRFDRLGEALSVAQVAAALGREFSYPLLEAVARRPQTQLRHALKALQAAQLLFRVGDAPEVDYTFKHALIRDAVYHSLLKSQRQPIHGRIAHMLEKKFPNIAQRQPELVAYHYQEAALYDLAIDYWQKAGLRALEHSANHEAIGHFKQGLALLLRLPDTAERQQKELLLQSALGVPLTMIQGYSAPEVERTYARALALSQTGGAPPQRFTALRGLWLFYLVKAEYRTALKLSKQLLHIAQKNAQDPALLMEAQATLGVSLFYCSDVTRARAHLREALGLYRPKAHRLHAFLYGRDPGVACGSFNAWALLLLGYPDQARQAMVQSVQLAERQTHLFSLAYALHFDAIVQHESYRQPLLTERKAHALMALSQEQGFPLFLSTGMFFEGWARMEKGQGQEGIARMRQGIEIWQSTGMEVSQTQWAAMLAEAYGMTGQVERGLEINAAGFSAMHKNKEIFYQAELCRVQGELLLRSGELSAAEDSFQQALAVAQRQKTKLLELRAAIGLSRLWQKTGKRQEAQKLLGDIYAWFTEGFDTADLKQAKALLKELN